MFHLALRFTYNLPLEPSIRKDNLWGKYTTDSSFFQEYPSEGLGFFENFFIIKLFNLPTGASNSITEARRCMLNGGIRARSRAPGTENSAPSPARPEQIAPPPPNPDSAPSQSILHDEPLPSG